ncbi:peptidoglycan bridge formation glycyltransferase FemA/FemB family protein [archaeon]|jgi:hypothetical protein|nr:peptidoglycan bridge formation glycyltransferase FemA/FemB family protein [archaeon]MBT6762393.1 peptidoglycan bridge formation glycyltransferase FemA/FemB family protein [archaeon]
MNIKILEPSEYDDYSKFISQNSSAQFEHSLTWAKILQDNFKHKPINFIAKDDAGIIQACIVLFECQGFFGPKNLISSPYSIFTNILANNSESKTELIKKAIDHCKDQELGFLQIRSQHQDQIFNSVNLIEKKNVFNMSLKLDSDINITWKKLPKSSIRWGIKKAEKSKISFSKGVAPMHLDQFYNLFLSTRKHRGVPAYPKKYFQDIINGFGNNSSFDYQESSKAKDHSDVKIYITYHNEDPIAAIFLIYYNSEMRYFAAGATYNRELLSMQPYHLIMWEAIKDATEQGYKVFNLGGATTSTNNGGLLTFKKRWSDTIEEIPYYYYLNNTKKIPNTEESGFIKIATKIWKILPSPIINQISPLIIKRFN